MDAIENVDTDYACVWLFNENLSELFLACEYDSIEDQFYKGLVLRAVDYPNYFKGIINENIISADNARAHLRMSEFNEEFLIPDKVYSVLDFILHKDGKPVGVISCEKTEAKKNGLGRKLVI